MQLLLSNRNIKRKALYINNNLATVSKSRVIFHVINKIYIFLYGAKSSDVLYCYGDVPVDVKCSFPKHVLHKVHGMKNREDKKTIPHYERGNEKSIN